MIARARDLMRRFMASAGGLWTLKDPRYWGEMLGGGRKTVSSEWVGEESALNYSAVWCATQLFCGIGGSLPLPVYKGLDDERRQKVRQHPVYRLLNVSPNPEQTAFSFRSIMWQWQVNWGNAYAEIEREGNTRDAPIVNLWPIHPDRVRIKRDDTHTLYYEVRDEYEHKWDEVDAWRIWHLPSILTSDGVLGRGVVQYARETIGCGLASTKAKAHGFGGGNVPRVVIEHPGKMEDKQRLAFRQEWHEVHDSATGESVALLGGGAKASPLSFSNHDSQFLELMGHDVDEIGRWYGLPPHMLRRLVNSTYNNIELLGAEFIRYTLNPWLENWEQSIAKDLLNERERRRYFAEHNVDAILRGDAASRVALYHSGINDGWMSRNQARKMENMDPVPGGDTFLVQGAMVPLDENGKPPEAVKPAPAGPSPAKPADDAGQIRADSELARRLLKRDLGRMLTKETKAVLHIAKNGGNFAAKVEEFYGKHLLIVQESTLETCEVLMNGKSPMFASKWCGSGKTAVLDAGSANVQTLVASRAWTQRPERTIEEMAT